MIVKITVLLFVCLIFAGCSSAPEPAKKDTSKVQQPTTIVRSNVGIKNPDGSITSQMVPGAQDRIIVDPKTGKKYVSKGWVDAKNGSLKLGKHLRTLSNDQLKSKLGDASPFETTLIIEEFKSRGPKSISGLAMILEDKRKAVFPRGREYWWYEKKGEPGEAVELRVFAALTIQFVSGGIRPEGIVMDMTKDRLIYAQKGQFAVVKEDLMKVWVEWWNKNKVDFK